MYKLRVDAMGLKDSFIVYGETKEEVIAKMFQYLERKYPEFVGPTNIQRLAELDAMMKANILEE